MITEGQGTERKKVVEFCHCIFTRPPHYRAIDAA